MNIFIGLMLILALLGLSDKIFSGKLGLSPEFDKGLITMGSLALSIIGIYSMGITLVRAKASAISAVTSGLPFDPSLIIGSLLAPDLGGYPIALELASNKTAGIFSAALVASTLGTVISFQLPVFLSSLHKQEIPRVMFGIILGVMVLPPTLFVGGLCLGMPIGPLLLNLLPIIFISLGLSAAFVVSSRKTTAFFLFLGNIVRILTIASFGAVILGLFIPELKMVEDVLVMEALVIVVKMSIIIAGAMVLAKFFLKYCRGFINYMSRKLFINEYAVIGLFLSLISSVSMLPLFTKMDTRGKLMNSAFSVSGAYVIGGQMAFMASVADKNVVFVYIITKCLGGVLALLAVRIFDYSKDMPPHKEAISNLESSLD